MRLNCVVVALALWFRARFRTGIAVKRSDGLHGLIPHFMHMRERKRGRAPRGGIYAADLLLEDFIPLRRKHGFLDDGDSFVVFEGMFRTRIYRLVAVSTAGSLFGARRGAIALAEIRKTGPSGDAQHEQTAVD